MTRKTNLFEYVVRVYPIETKKEFILPNSDISRTFVIVQKKKETPKKFPRKAGLPSKEPLC